MGDGPVEDPERNGMGKGRAGRGGKYVIMGDRTDDQLAAFVEL